MNTRLLLLVLSLLVLRASPLPLTAAPERVGPLEVELIAETTGLVSGRPFTVALRMRHDPEWHSYWVAPGTGLPTTLTWTLPEGFRAGPIQWPVPRVVQDASGRVTGNGYTGEVYLLVQITPPDNLVPGSIVKLAADAEWLLCRESCVPGGARLELSLPVVRAESLVADASLERLFAGARSRLPQTDTGWKLVATRTPSSVRLQFNPPAGITHPPVAPHFFSADALTDLAHPSVLRAEPQGSTLELPLAPESGPRLERLRGVLVSQNGWQAGSGYAGLAVDLPLLSATGPAPDEPTARGDLSAGAVGLFGTLGLAFVGGLILNLMPCVFPVLGIKILGFVNQAGNDRRKITLHGLVFALGVLLSFWVMAGALLALRAGGAQLGWGFQLQSPGFVFGMAVFMLLFALNMSGLFEVGMAATGVGGSLQMKSGFTGSFFTGALATLVATPCSAPFLAPALGAALSLPAVEALLVFTAIAVGLAVPYLLLSFFPQAVKMLPRPGAWMETFKQFMAFPLYATVGWLVWVLAGQMREDENALLLATFGFVLVAMAAWAYGRFGQNLSRPGRRMLGMVGAVLLLLSGFLTGWPGKSLAAAAGDPVQWGRWSPEAVAEARLAGKVVYVDFTARWCATCQTNKAAVFHDKTVLAELARRGVVLLRADWTSRDPLITAELARWNRSAVPLNLVYGPRGTGPTILSELLTPTAVLNALQEASGKVSE